MQAAAAIENARLYRNASESNQRQDGELATLAHELRNPLGAIINALHVLERSGAPDAQTARLRALIHRQAKHLSRLVEDVLDVARLRHSKLRLKREPVDLCDIVRQAIDTLSATGRGEHYNIQSYLAVDRLIVPGDPTRLEQVVRNLLDNAVKYSPPGTVIGVSVEAGDAEAVLSVRDQGTGIEEAMLPRLFDPFAQAAPATSRAAGGLGLGLPLVRAIVEQHGGSITAHSDGLGKGSQFTVRLPSL
jgi:signal transduction histidine kinase